MKDVIPQHASLPLWQDKNTEEKRDTLQALFDSLCVYTMQQGKSQQQILNLENSAKYEENKALILSMYREILGSTLSGLVYKLKCVTPYDEQEKKDIMATIAFISANPNALNMNCEKGHITGSGLIIHPETNRVLLHRHKKLGIWLQFGGHSDFEIDITKTAAREAMEESGLSDLKLISLYNDNSIPIDVEVQTIPQKGQNAKHIHFDLRYLFATNNPEGVYAQDGESKDFWWLTIEEAQKVSEKEITPAVKRLISKADTYIKTRYLPPNDM